MGEHKTFTGERPRGDGWKVAGEPTRLTPALEAVANGERGSSRDEPWSGVIFRGLVRRLGRSYRRAEASRARSAARRREANAMPMRVTKAPAKTKW